ncbi:hypothetical protein [Streptomyces sp. SID12501]|uniref:Uncharacterized protein n=1 Tax=Streptomyces sp. SID12501 TaxID=2706042 RepID=A0A6B3BWM0_9ACTN|nr:hypothetical protein [Streptomyces sp. SID12501]NEC88784.1 hypothetical protein [Streptomyces sp. SID12501]
MPFVRPNVTSGRPRTASLRHRPNDQGVGRPVPRRQEQLFGAAPTAEDALGRYTDELGMAPADGPSGQPESDL